MKIEDLRIKSKVIFCHNIGWFILLVKMERKNDKNGLYFNRCVYLTLQWNFITLYNE